MNDFVAETYQPIKTAEISGSSSIHPFPGISFSELPQNKLHRLSPVHKRSFGSEIINGKVVFSDEFGNRFTSVTYKGLPPIDEIPFIEDDGWCASGFRTKFLCDTDDSKDINEISKTLRSKGLNTEHIIKETLLDHIIYGGAKISIPDLKNQMRVAYYDSHPNLKPEQKTKIDKYINEAKYVALERLLPVNERLIDIDYALTSTNFDRFISSLKTYFDEEYQGVKFDGSPQSMFDYLTKVLPVRMGRYLGKFHQAGYIHRYATVHNWLLTGDLCDLDGVEKINPQSSTFDDYKNDLGQTYIALGGLYERIFQEFFIKHNLLSVENKKPEKKIAQEAFSFFTEAYANETGISIEQLNKFSDFGELKRYD